MKRLLLLALLFGVVALASAQIPTAYTNNQRFDRKAATTTWDSTWIGYFSITAYVEVYNEGPDTLFAALDNDTTYTLASHTTGDVYIIYPGEYKYYNIGTRTQFIRTRSQTGTARRRILTEWQ